MSLKVNTDPTLSPSAPLYRTLDFYSAAAIVTQSKLMFSRADTFIDQNEGIDRLLAQLESSRPNSGCGMGWTDAQTAKREHARVKRSHYISCWTRTAESVAMWSLYSPDFCAVRISTSLHKLAVTTQTLLDKYSVTRLSADDLGAMVVAAIEGRISPVVYASLPRIAKFVSRRAKARARLVERYARTGTTEPAINELADVKYWAREDKRRFSQLRTTCSLKDMSFQHEEEVRLAVRLGEEPCTTHTIDSHAWADPGHEYHVEFQAQLKAWQFIHSAELPEREFITCPSDLVESVALDPRCPPHKAAFMKAWFSERGIKIVDSTCFGYLAATFTAYPYS